MISRPSTHHGTSTIPTQKTLRPSPRRWRPSRSSGCLEASPPDDSVGSDSSAGSPKCGEEPLPHRRLQVAYAGGTEGFGTHGLLHYLLARPRPAADYALHHHDVVAPPE